MKIKRIVLALLLCVLGFNLASKAEESVEQAVAQEITNQNQADNLENQEANLPSQNVEEGFDLEDMLDEEAIDLDEEFASPEETINE